MKRRYFIMVIGNIEDPTQLTYLQEALYLCIGEPQNQRFSLDGGKLLIKTNNLRLMELLIRFPNLTLEQLLIDTNTIEITDLTILNTIEWELPNNTF